jgi:hypothetical protein
MTYKPKSTALAQIEPKTPVVSAEVFCNRTSARLFFENHDLAEKRKYRASTGTRQSARRKPMEPAPKILFAQARDAIRTEEARAN